MIAENKVIVFSKITCPYCANAKAHLRNGQVECTVIELDMIENGGNLHEALKVVSGQRTVPNIYVQGKHIGGADDLFRMTKSGEM